MRASVRNKEADARRAEYERRQAVEQKRIKEQRESFDDLTDGPIRDHVKDMMLQRAYDLMCDGQAEAADALCEFLPVDESDAMMNAWLDDQMDDGPKSKWY